MTRGLGVGKETTWGTPVTAQRWYDIIRENLRTRKTVIIDSDTVASREILKAVRGTEHVEGDVEMYLNSMQIGHALLSLMGSVSTTGSGPYTHTFSVGDTLPSLTLRSRLDSVTEKVFAGCVVDSLDLTAETGKARVTLGIIGRSESLGTPSTPSFTTQDDFVSGEATITLAGSTKRPRRLSLRVTNNLEPIFVLGDYFTQRPRPRKFEVTGSFELDFESTSEYNDFLNLTPRDLTVKFTKGSHSIEFDIDRFVYTNASVEVRGRELLVGRFDFRALKPTTVSTLRVILVNDDSSY